MYDLVIVGGGAAAAAAAFYAIEKQLDTLMVYEDLGGKVGQRESLIGCDQGELESSTRRYVRRDDGDVAELIPPLPANRAVRLLLGYTMHAGHVRHDRVVRISRHGAHFSLETAAMGVLHSHAIILATGAAPRWLDVPGADRLVDRSMDYSIATYAQHTRGQQVAVIGGTERALLGAAELAHVAQHVFVIVPDQESVQTPLSMVLRQQHNITFTTGYDVSELIGGHSLEAIRLRSNHDTRLISVQRAFVDLGLKPNSDLVQHFGCANQAGFIVVDEQMRTCTPGLFAAGDVTSAFGEHALIAIGDGTRAAKSAHMFVLTRALAGQRTQERAVAT